jgi:hypothetical protein
MGRLADILKGNIFWVAIGVALAGILLTWQFVAEPMAEQIRVRRTEGTKAVDDLQRWAAKPFIPTDATIASARQETAALRGRFGQLELMFASRGPDFDANFAALANMQGGAMGRFEAFKWTVEYGRLTGELIARAKEEVGSPNSVMNFPEQVEPTALTMPQVAARQRSYWTQRAVVDSLIRANRTLAAELEKEATSRSDAAEDDDEPAAPASAAPSPPLQKLLSIRPAPKAVGGMLSHPWLHLNHFTVQFTMQYKNVHRFLAVLQNQPQPLVVSSMTVQAPKKPDGDTGGAGGIDFRKLQHSTVTLLASQIEYRPQIHSIAFSGTLFNADGSVEGWIRRNDRELLDATMAVALRVSDLQERVGAVSDTTIRTVLKNLKERYAKRLDRIKANAEEQLKLTIAAAKKQADNNTLTAEQERKILADHKAGVARVMGTAQKEYSTERDSAIRRLFVAADGACLLYDHLHPLAGSEAFTVGRSSVDRRAMVVRLPPGARLGGGRWWLFGEPKSGKAEIINPRDGAREFRTALGIAARYSGGRLTAVYLDVPRDLKRRVVVFCDDKGLARRLLVERAAGGWTVYDAIEGSSGEPASMGDVAFRYANVIHQAARRLATPAFAAAQKTITVTPVTELEGKRDDYAIAVSAPTTEGGRPVDGVVTVNVGMERTRK